MPKYSIILPTKNRNYCIWQAIQSVVTQSFQDWELLVVEGGEVAPTAKLINTFRDERIRLLPNPNDCGVGSARNRGLEQARGAYIAYLDSDDVLLEGWLSAMEEAISMGDGGVIFMPNKEFNIEVVDRDNRFIEKVHSGPLFPDGFGTEQITDLKVQCDTNGMVHTAASILETGPWNENLGLYEDFELLLRFCEKFPDGIRFVDKTLVRYTRRYGSDGLCGQATYALLAGQLDAVYALHGEKPFLKDQTWYPGQRDKYLRLAEAEKLDGSGIIDRLRAKYGKV
jgi:succinoglycan biosynthesis protein ExoO